MAKVFPNIFTKVSPVLTKLFPICALIFKCLISFSDVFEAMFNHMDVVENKKSQVTLKDDQPEAMAKLLEFIYTDRLKEESGYG